MEDFLVSLSMVLKINDMQNKMKLQKKFRMHIFGFHSQHQTRTSFYKNQKLNATPILCSSAILCSAYNAGAMLATWYS
jgi:hypothetical protein